LTEVLLAVRVVVAYNNLAAGFHLRETLLVVVQILVFQSHLRQILPVLHPLLPQFHSALLQFRPPLIHLSSKMLHFCPSSHHSFPSFLHPCPPCLPLREYLVLIEIAG
jgi:hypothetical protein